MSPKLLMFVRETGLAGRYVRSRATSSFWSAVVRWEKASPTTYRPVQRLYRTINPERERAELPPYGTVVTIAGIKMLIDPVMTPFQVRKLVEGRHAAQERKLLLPRLRPGERVLELGGGIGMLSIAIAKTVGPRNVVAYEPNPGLEALARENHRLNDVAPELRVAMLGPAAGSAEFRVSANFSRSSVLAHDPGAQTITVPVHPVAQVMAQVDPQVLVMDVQGAETELLPLVPLAGLRLLLVELHPDLVGLQAVAKLRGLIRDGGLDEVERAGQSFLFERQG